MSFLFIVISVGVITALIVVHEFGHFLAAKYYGFQTPIFGVGLPFGPHMDLFKKWGTQFRLYFLLIGGFVSIPELGDESDAELMKEFKLERPMREFPVWQRAVVASGGIAFNVLFAFLLCIVMAATIGIPTLMPDNQVGGYVSENAPAKKAGLEIGDKIVRVDSYEIINGNELKQVIQKLFDKDIVLLVQRPLFKLDSLDKKLRTQDEYETLKIKMHSEGSLGIILANKKEYKQLEANPLVWVLESLKFTFTTFISMFFSIIALLGALFAKLINIFVPGAAESSSLLGQVKGIVGIVQLISEDIQANSKMLLELTILLSLNLAVINILPIPALDGGHLMFMTYEAIIGKKIANHLQQTAIQLGFLFLLGIMAVTTFNDVRNWIFS